MSDVPELPDFLGIKARIHTVADLLQDGQGQLQRFQSLMIVNNKKPDDFIQDQTDDVPSPPTFQQRFDALESGMAALLAENADIAKELAVEASLRQKAVERRLDRERDAE